MHMEVRALFGRFVWRGVNIDDVTIHPSRGSKINPTLKVCEHNRVAHASTATQIMYWCVVSLPCRLENFIYLTADHLLPLTVLQPKTLLK